MKQIKSIVLICICLLFLFSVGKTFHDRFHLLGASIGSFVTKSSKASRDTKFDEMKVENHLMRQMVSEMKEEQKSDQMLAHLLERYFAMSEKKGGKAISDFTSRLDHQMRFVSAKVIFREPSFWGSYCWIDKGVGNGEGVVKIDSPVVVGDDVVGVIDYVDTNRARVQLITDHRLPISVQASRGDEQNLQLLSQIDCLIESLELREDLFSSDLLKNLKQLLGELKKNGGNRQFAKGQVFGSSYSLFRKRVSLLKGIGFDMTQSIEKGDLLVTTGMDGVFPRGFRVASVTHVKRLKEGDIAYELEAKSTYPALDDLTTVQVLPSLRQNRYFNAPSL